MLLLLLLLVVVLFAPCVRATYGYDATAKTLQPPPAPLLRRINSEKVLRKTPAEHAPAATSTATERDARLRRGGGGREGRGKKEWVWTAKVGGGEGLKGRCKRSALNGPAAVVVTYYSVIFISDTSPLSLASLLSSLSFYLASKDLWAWSSMPATGRLRQPRQSVE